MAAKAKVDIITRPITAEVLAAFAALRQDKCETCGGLQTAGEQLHGASVFEVMIDGASVGYYALRINRYSGGSEGVIVAAVGGADGVDLTATVLPIIEKHQLRDCNAVKIETARRVLAGKLLAQGYKGHWVMRKTLRA